MTDLSRTQSLINGRSLFQVCVDLCMLQSEWCIFQCIALVYSVSGDHYRANCDECVDVQSPSQLPKLTTNGPCDTLRTGTEWLESPSCRNNDPETMLRRSPA